MFHGGPLGGVVDMSEQVNIGEAQRPWVVICIVGPSRRQSRAGRDPAIARALTPDLKEVVVEPCGSQGFAIDVDPDSDSLDVGALLTTDLGAPLGPATSVTAAPGRQLDPFLKDGRGPNLHHRAPHDPIHRVRQVAVGGIVAGDIL